MTRRMLVLQVASGGLAIALGLSAQSFASAREAAATYLVQPGETLSGISVSTGVPLDKLVGMNALTNPDLIVAGQVLQLVGTASAPAAPATYTVKPGDTLWDISMTMGVPLESLISLNNLDNPDSLTVGQQLKLATTAPSATLRSASAPAGVSQASAPQNGTLVAASAPAAADKPPTPDKPGAQTAAGKPGGQTQASSKPTAQAQAAEKRAAVTQALQQKVIAEARRVGGPNVRIGVSAKNLVSGERIAVNAADAFPSASVMKLPILVELERQASSGQRPWTDSLRSQANAMITISDNYAADQIANAIGFKPVNETMARLGLSATHLRNLFADSRSAQNPGFNDTTPADMVRLLELIATDQAVSSQASADMRSLLARNSDRSKLVRLLPGDAKVMHKSGWYESVANDVGIVSVDRTGAKWVIAVFAQNVPDAETGNQLLAAVSKAVYDAWAGADNS